MRPLIVLEKLDKNIEPHNFAYGKILDLIETHPESVILCLELGAHDLKGKAKIFSLGKEMRFSKLHEFLRLIGFILKKHKEYDRVLVYKTPTFLAFGGLLWRLVGKKTVFWYNHSYNGADVKLAAFFANKVVTPVENGFPGKSKKVVVLKESSFKEALEQ